MPMLSKQTILYVMKEKVPIDIQVAEFFDELFQLLLIYFKYLNTMQYIIAIHFF